MYRVKISATIRSYTVCSKFTKIITMIIVLTGKNRIHLLGAATYRVSPTVVVDAVAARLQHHLCCGGHCGFVSHEDDWHRFWRKAVSGDQTKPEQSSVLLSVPKHGGNGLKKKEN